MKQHALLLVGLLTLSGLALAEGGSCPAGYYPVGGQGSQGCAPIPNYNRGQQSPAQQQAPRPTGYWEKTWGAIAPSPKGGGVGHGLGCQEQAGSRASSAS